jgi:hypothetical protein
MYTVESSTLAVVSICESLSTFVSNELLGEGWYTPG